MQSFNAAFSNDERYGNIKQDWTIAELTLTFLNNKLGKAHRLDGGSTWMYGFGRKTCRCEGIVRPYLKE